MSAQEGFGIAVVTIGFVVALILVGLGRVKMATVWGLLTSTIAWTLWFAFGKAFWIPSAICAASLMAYIVYRILRPKDDLGPNMPRRIHSKRCLF